MVCKLFQFVQIFANLFTFLKIQTSTNILITDLYIRNSEYAYLFTSLKFLKLVSIKF